MNMILVSPLLAVSSDGPVAIRNNEQVHLRQGDLDGACGPYCIFMALIAMGIMTRSEAQNMHTWDGRTLEAKFRENLEQFGAFIRNGTEGKDLVGFAKHFKSRGIKAVHLEGTKKIIFLEAKNAIDQCNLPIIEVNWQGGGAHWLLVVGYQGVDNDGNTKLTHLLCLDPSETNPKANLWNLVLEVFKPDGTSVSKGVFTSNYWGSDGNITKCQIVGAVILSLQGGL